MDHVATFQRRTLNRRPCFIDGTVTVESRSESQRSFSNLAPQISMHVQCITMLLSATQ